MPQCEWTTRRVQKMASVTGVVQMNGTMNAGICAADTTLSAFHIVAWSIIPDIVRAGVVEKWEAAENLFTLDDRMDEPAEATVVNCWFCRATNFVLAPFLAAMAAADLLSAVCRHAEEDNRDVAQNIFGIMLDYV